MLGLGLAIVKKAIVAIEFIFNNLKLENSNDILLEDGSYLLLE